MPFLASPLSLASAGLYLIVACAAGAGALVAQRNRQASWHRRSWLGLAGIFACLVVSRMLGLEEIARDLLREGLRIESAYEARREFQRPIAAAAFALTSLFGLWLFYFTVRKLRKRRDRAVVIANVAGLGMLLLVALRITSLHTIDVLLYGPLKLNWTGDLGLCLLVAAAAIYYVRLVSSSR